MPFVQAKCPECGGMLAVDDSKKAANCQFCGEAFIVQEAVNNYNTYNTTNNTYDNRTTHNYGNGTIVNNVYEDKSKDFVIEVGVLKEYHGESVDIIVPDTVKEIPATCFKNLNIESISICHDDVMVHDDFRTNLKLKNITVSEDIFFDWAVFLSAYTTFTEEKLIDRIKIVPGNSHNNSDPLEMLLMFGFYPKVIEIDDDCFKYKVVDGCIINTSSKTIIQCNQSKTGVYKIPTEISRIGYKAFYNCSLLNSVVMHDEIFSIEHFAFANCSSLQTIDLPTQITDIGVATFENCSRLTSLVIPKSVLKIRTDAFRGCTGLKRLSIPGHLLSHLYTVESWGFDVMFKGAEIEELEITASNEKRDSYLARTEKNGGATSFFNLFTVNLKKVVISDNIKELEDYAFYRCSYIESIVLPNSLTKIGKMAFYGCNRLKEFKIPDKVEEIESEAFQNCYDLVSIDFPHSVKRIGEEAFAHCSNLRSVKIFNPRVEIGVACFLWDSKIEILYISENAAIADGAFHHYWASHNRCYVCGGELGLFNRCKKCKTQNIH